MRKMAFVAIVSFLALTTSATAQHPHVICAREVGVQLNSRGQSITQTWHFRTSDAYGRCMDRYRRGRTTSGAAAPGAAAHAGVQQTRAVQAGSAAQLASQSVSKTTVSAKTLKLSHFVSVNPDCSSRGASEIRVLAPPRNGRLNVMKTSDFPSFPTDSSYSRCNSARVPGTAVTYLAKAGFSGQESVQVRVFYPTGQARDVSYSIAVVP